MSNEVAISLLKPEYIQKILSNQKKYNPDFNETLNSSELDCLMKDLGIKDKEALLNQGLVVETTSNKKIYSPIGQIYNSDYFKNEKSRWANDLKFFKKVFSGENIKQCYKEWMKCDTELRRKFQEQNPIVSTMRKDGSVIKIRESLDM